MANNYTVQLKGNFDYTQVINGIKEIKKQISSVHLGDDIAKDLQKSLEKIDLKLPKIENLINKDQLNEKEIEKLQKLIQEIQKDIISFNDLVNKTNFTEAFSSIDLSKIESLDKQIKNIQDKVQTARQELIDTFTKENQIDLKNNVVQEAITNLFSVEPSQVKTKFEEIQNTIESQLQETENKIKELTENDISSGPKIIQALFGDESTVTIVKGKVTEFKNQLNELLQQFKSLTPGTEEARNKLREIFELINNYTKNKNKEKIFQGPSPDDLDAITQLKNHLEKIEELSKTKEEFFSGNESERVKVLEERVKLLEERLKELENLQPSLSSKTKDLAKNVDILNDETQEAAEKERQLKAQQEALNNTFGALASRIEHAVSAIAIFNKSMQIIRNAIKSVEDLDAAFTQIAIVSEQSNEQAWQMFESFNKLAKQYSITTKDLAEGAKLFYQQGLNAADTMKMVEASTVSAALGEVTMTEAANTLTAAIQGYNESAAVAMDYTDKIAMVGAVSAADFNELSAAMEKTASSAYTAGIDFDHLLGYLGKMIEVTREAPANLGTAMKTIIARFEDMKKDPMAILEDGVSANKVEAALATIGIALRDSEGEFRALQDVFDELGMKWQSLTRNQQAYIATVAAGSRQQSRFLAMMNNYDRTLDLIAESQNSAGAAAKQYAIYQDSIAAAQARLTASWENFYSKIVDNGIIKFVLNGLSEIIDSLSRIPPIITAIGATIGALQLQNFITDKGGIIGIFSNILKGKDLKGEAVKSAKDVVETFANTSFSELRKKSPTIIGGFKSLAKAIGGASSEIASGFIGVTKAGAAFVAANWEIMAVIAGVALVIDGLTRLLNAQRIAYEQNIEQIKKLNEEANEYATRSNNGKDLFKTYDELSSKISLTDDEQAELNSTIKQISEIYPEAITYLDEYGNMQIANAEQIRDTIEAERQLAQERKKDALEKKGEVLEKSEDQWTKEGFENVGLSTNYFSNKDEIKRLKNLKEEAKILSTFKDFKFDSRFISDRETFIDTLNNYNKKFSLGLKVLAKNATDEMIEEYGKAIGEANFDTIISSLEEKQELIKKQLLKKNNIELSFVNLKFSDNSSIATSQRVLASQIQAIFEKMDIDVWESLFGEDGNPEDFAKKIQEIIDVVSKNNALELTQLFKDFNAGKISVKEFKDKFKEIAKLAEGAGVDSAIAFAESFGEQLDNQLDKEKEKFLNYFENIGVQSETRTEKAEKLQLGQGQIYQDYTQNYLTNSEGKVMAYAATKLLQIPAEQIQQFEQQVKEAVEAGDASALADIQTQWLETWGKIDEEVANLLVNGRIVDAFHQFSRDYVTEIANAASGLFGKKDYSSIDISEGVNYYNTFDEGNGKNSFWDHATIGDDGKLQLDTYAQLKVAQEDINKTVQEYNDKIIDAKAEIASNTELTEKQKEELQECINYWEEAIKKAGKASDSVEVIIEQTKELSNLTSDWAATLEEAVDSSSENAKALQASSDAAKEYEEVVDVVEKLEKDIKNIGHISRENMDALTAHGDFYQDFFTIDEETGIIQLNNMVENYANATDAIKAIARNRQEFELEMKRQEIEAEAKKARDQADAYDILAQVFYDYANDVNAAQGQMTQTEREELAKQYTNQITEAKKGLEAADTNYNALMQACEDTYRWMSTLDATYWANIGKDGIANAVEAAIAQRKAANAAAKAASGDIINLLVNGGGVADLRKQGDQFKSMADSLRAYADSLEASKDRLKIIDPTVYNKLADKLEKAGKAGKDAMNKIGKAVEKVLDDVEKLNDIIIDLNKNLRDIEVNYKPFMDLFEAWEHEWDYYYNIKQLIAQLGQQGQWIDNVISADYTSAEEKMAAYDAKIGNITAKMAANDAYILTLRQGIAQNALELEKKFGQYYNVDNVMGSWQVYQKDTNLHEWNDVANAIKKASYELSKIINQQENELNLLETTQDALEQERSAYESILSTVDSVIDSLKDNEDITVDLSELQNVKAELEVAIKDESVENIKEQIRNLNDYMQELQWQLDLNDNVVLKGIDDAVEDMEELRDKIQEYIDTMNEAIAEQQELVGQLSEVYSYYVDTAISTEQELYNAIVENYQNEINQKKKQYDYLKQLDNDYLNSIKNNINKERQAREDANKQKSYQQNIQRAQLLAMDTSGAYRKELANLNKEIEGQRQDLYDDLVDKQVEALETEIKKRHELYDLEVSMLEERLAYMQENAILLWEMVNEIVANGSEAMMATLENTMDYINSNELAKDRQRKQWELSIQATYKGVVDREIENLNIRIQKGNEYIKNLEEIKNAIEDNVETYQQSTTLLVDENANFQSAMDAYMQTWTDMTNGMTGYYSNWQTTVNAIKTAIEKDIEELEALGEEGGGIEELDQKLRQSAKDMYDSFIEERKSYKEQLTKLIGKIETDISAAIKKAANAITSAANSIKVNPNSPGPDNPTPPGPDNPTPPGPDNPTPTPTPVKTETCWEAIVTGYTSSGTPHKETGTGTATTVAKAQDLAYQAAVRKMPRNIMNVDPKSKASFVKRYLQGGLANFTGLAWLDGTPSKPEAVLNPKQTKLFESMVSSLERASNNSNINSSFGSSYNVGDINTSINVAKLDNQTDIDKVAKAVEDKIVKTIRNRVSISINKGV